MLSQDRLLGADRPNRHASQLARAKHFENNLASMEKNLTDAQAAMDELLKDTPAFTQEQRKSMAEAITSFMDSSVAPTTASCKNQIHPYLHHYMTDTIWKQLRDKQITWSEKKEAFVDFLMERIGLRYPNNDTLKLMLSIMWNAAEATLSPDDAYQELQSLHEIFVNKRPIITGRALMQEYDRDVSQFTRLYPHQFLQCDPPVASQIEDRKLLQKMRRDLMPSRNTNKQLKEKTAPQPRQAGASDLQSMMMQFVLGQMQGLPMHMGSHAPSRAPRQPRALTNGPLALTDGQPDQEQRETLPHIPPAARETAPADGVRAIVDQAKAVINAGRRGGKKTKKTIAKDKGTTKAMKKHKKKPDDDDEETPDEEEEHEKHENEEEEEEDEEPESEEETNDDDIMKRPSAVSKRPAADLNKKPAGNRPKPVFDEPLHWGGGRVYYSASKRAWRVYKRGSDKVESTVSVNAESASNIKTQWQKVLNAIENDPRPSNA